MRLPKPNAQSIYWSGRTFSVQEVRLLQDVVSDFPGLSVTELSRTVCELLEWRRPNGHLKNHECRLLLEDLAQRGWIALPAVREQGPHGPRGTGAAVQTQQEGLLTGTAGKMEPLELEVIRAGADDSALWRELIDRHHYLGYRVPVGANLRYLVRSGGGRLLACLLWTSPAWKMAVRDRWIGWSDSQRRRNLQLIVNNARFLILPWVRIKGLASKILSRCARRLPEDWEDSYGYRPLLLETLVDTTRFRGTCYRAANWIHLGQTRGRGRMDRDHISEEPVKDVYVYPLWADATARLRTDPAPVFSGSMED